MTPQGRAAAKTQINFETLDLNLLRVFDAVNEERSVAAAAERLGQTPSAVSHALSRLRYALNDELFVRAKSGIQLTSRAAEIAPQLRQLLLQIQLVLAPTEFVPAQTQRRFTITCGPYAASVLLPKFVVRLRALAPRSELCIRWDDCDVVEELTSGRIDLAIGSFGRCPKTLQSDVLFHDTMVWAVSASNVSSLRQLTIDMLARLPHLIATSTGHVAEASGGFVTQNGLERCIETNDNGALDRALAERGLQRTVGLIVPSFMLPWTLVSGVNLAALVPRRQALLLPKGNKLKLFEPPYRSPPMTMHALWHRDFGSRPAVVWFRNLLKEVAAEL